MFDSQQNTSATATSVEHAERKTSNNNLRGGATSSSNLTLSSNEDLKLNMTKCAFDFNRNINKPNLKLFNIFIVNLDNDL